MSLPGFNAEASLYDRAETDATVFVGGSSEISNRVVPQLRRGFRTGISSDPDLGSYWRCRLNGGPDLVCRFFGGLPPFTIGGLLF